VATPAPAGTAPGVTSDPTALLAVLAEESRLRVFAAVLLHPGPTREVLAAAGVREREGLRLLSRLEAAGLLARDGAGWRARPEVLRDSVAHAAPAPAYVDHGAADPEAAAVLRTFMPRGRLERIPAARGKRMVVLDQICRVFEPGVRYSERDVSTLLSAFHPDYAALRRYLVDEGFLAREAGRYWRIGGTVET
jgi:hypothetical protein